MALGSPPVWDDFPSHAMAPQVWVDVYPGVNQKSMWKTQGSLGEWYKWWGWWGFHIYVSLQEGTYYIYRYDICMYDIYIYRYDMCIYIYIDMIYIYTYRYDMYDLYIYRYDTYVIYIDMIYIYI